MFTKFCRDNELEPYIEEFKAYYGEHLKDTTAPYPGILDMLDVLREQGYKLAIVSNKIQEGVTPLNKEYFGDRLPVAIGKDRAYNVNLLQIWFYKL